MFVFAEGSAVLAVKDNVLKRFRVAQALSALGVAVVGDRGAGSEGVGDAAHAHECACVLVVVETAGVCVKIGEVVVPFAVLRAKEGEVCVAHAIIIALRQSGVERRVEHAQHSVGVEGGS